MSAVATIAPTPAAPPPAAAGKPATSSRWILGSWRDLMLYVCTPLLIVPVFAAAQRRWSAQDIYLFVAAFGATGHHLPGMIRAYGDRALFERFKVRFMVAPIFLIAVCTLCSAWDLKGLEVVVFAWGIWHGLMQTYGFCRIYDAKAGAFGALNRRLDFAMCLAWFGSAVLLSPLRLRAALDLYYAGGGPLIPPGAIAAVQAGVAWLTGAITLAFFVALVLGWRQGRRVNPVKLVLMAASFGFWWYCNLGVANLILGIALFEVFHDVQYLSIVWLYNRNRVEKDSSIGGFMRFVFRKSGTLVGIYVGLVLGYGALALAARGVSMEGVHRVLMGVVTASALLHFYYDGFIWKVRESSTRTSLGLDAGADAAARRWMLPPWLLHGLKWSVFILPLAALGWLQFRPLAPAARLAVREAVVAVAPEDPAAHNSLAMAALQSGRLDAAVAEFREVLRLAAARPDSRADMATFVAGAHFNLASVLKQQWDLDEAKAHYLEAIRLQPDHAQAECNLANLEVELGRFAQAQAHYERSLQIEPEQELVHKNLADLLTRRGRREEALPHYEAAMRIRPGYAEARAGYEAARSGRL